MIAALLRKDDHVKRQDGPRDPLAGQWREAARPRVDGKRVLADVPWDSIPSLETTSQDRPWTDWHCVDDRSVTEAGSLAKAVLVARGEAVLAVGGVKGNIGHAEPAAGLTGLRKLALGLRQGEGAANAQLHWQRTS